MQTDKIDLNYQLCFQSPFHLGTGLRAGLIHRVVARDSQGYLYVPGSTIKGALRDRATYLANTLGQVGVKRLVARNPFDDDRPLHEFAPQPDIVALIFGSRTRAGTLFFDDATMAGEDKALFDGQHLERQYLARQVQVRGQVSISRLTGTARTGLLYTSEYGVEGLHFDGRIYGLLSGVPTMLHEEAPSYSLLLLLAALAGLDRLGGGKSRGAGQLTCTIKRLTVNDDVRDHQAILTYLEEFIVYDDICQQEEQSS